VNRLLAKRPEERPQSAAEVAAALAGSEPRRRGRWPRALVWGGAAAILVGVMMFASWWALFTRTPADKPATVVAPPTAPKPAPPPKVALIVHCGRGRCLNQDEVTTPGYGYRLVEGFCHDRWQPKENPTTYCWAGKPLRFEVQVPPRTTGVLRLFMVDGFDPGNPKNPPRQQMVFVQERRFGPIEDFRAGRSIDVRIRASDSKTGTIDVRVEPTTVNGVVSRLEFLPDGSR
jgi:hypothetical protein